MTPLNSMPPSDPKPVTPVSWAPTAKVSSGALAASLSVILINLAKSHGWAELGAADGAALTTLITFLVQYFVPERT